MSTIKVDTITDEAGSGAPDFPNGMTGSAASLTAIPAAQLTGTLPAIDGSALTGVDAFKPVAVTGATPSLDVGTYNFFSQGTLTANTTVSFASVPTEARWSYSFDVGSTRVGDLFDVSTASYLQSFSVSAQETSHTGIFFKPDGLKMYIVGSTGDDINEYDLSTAWDVSTAVYLQNFSVAGQDTVPYDIFFKPDGTKMYIAGYTGVDINEYDLSTAWDISTASYLQAFSVSAQDTSVVGVSFKSDGLKMYMLGQTNRNVYEYDLSTAWDISTSVFLQSFSVGTQDTGPRGIVFKPDGTKMYMAGATSDAVHEYDLSTAWDVSTASYLQNFPASSNTPNLFSVTFSTDGSIMYLLDGTNDNVVQYDVGTLAAVTLPASVENPPTVSRAVGEPVTYDFYTLDGGTTVTLIEDPKVEVGAAIAGLALGAVGTYAILQKRTNTTGTPGSTHAGSSCMYTSSGGSNSSNGQSGVFASGTWRTMGYQYPTTVPYEWNTTVMLRIS